MSVTVKTRPTVFQLYEAVKSNVSRPDAVEEKKYTVSKRLRASTSREGDSEIGLTLFIGIATINRIIDDEILSILAIEMDELNFKRKRFAELASKNDRFRNKIRLINNYLRLQYGIR